MLEVDIDDSGTVDFFEFLCVARLISQGKGTLKKVCSTKTPASSKNQSS